jgi:glycosyltransferase involved in cell wall biosynthesis
VNSISVVIAVYKPGNHLERLKKNLNEQIFSTRDSKVEIVLVDGECSPKTKEFCRTNSFRYVENPSVDPVSAKALGLVNSEFELVCFIDQDEEFSNNFALDNRIKEFNVTNELVLLFPTGYTVSKEMGSANIYTTLAIR